IQATGRGSGYRPAATPTGPRNMREIPDDFCLMWTVLFRSLRSVRLPGVAGAPIRYQSHDEDSARWLGFRFRPGDIVISTRRRTGTTWMQMICALLIFQRPELPAPLWHLSPRLDHMIAPLEGVYARVGGAPPRRL